MEKSDMVYGTRAVMEAARSGRQLERVFLQTGVTNDLMKELVHTLKERKVPYSWVPAEKLNRLTTKNHQGAVALISAVQYADLQAVIDHAYANGRAPFLLLLDRITDVRNFGAVARTCECLGLDAIVLEEKGNAPVTADAVKTSAGALNHLPVCKVSSLKQTMRNLRDNGILVVACTERATESLFQADLSGPLALVLGSEEDGIADALLKEADRLLNIPIQGKVASLNVSVAAGIAMYEGVRQRAAAQNSKK
jgi:23S rRNA (guanosine2251-2'-O)-methyltransferase